MSLLADLSAAVAQNWRTTLRRYGTLLAAGVWRSAVRFPTQQWFPAADGD